MWEHPRILHSNNVNATFSKLEEAVAVGPSPVGEAEGRDFGLHQGS